MSYSSVLPVAAGYMLVPDHDMAQTGALRRSGLPIDHDEIAAFAHLIKHRADITGSAGMAFDVGSCLGTWALALSRFEGVTEVHAFEPQRMLCNMIGGTMALNGIENVWVHHCAVGDRDHMGVMQKLDYNVDTQFGSVEFGTYQAEPLSQQTDVFESVPVVSLDSFMEGRKGLVHFIKLDVESMEPMALLGARRTIAEHRPVMYIEWLKCHKEDLAAMISDMGYKLHDTGFNFVCVPE